jgi:hypothetical protein
MKKVVWLKDENMAKWDEFVEKHPFGWICHLSKWRDILEKSFRHIKGHFLAIVDDESDNVLAGLPIYFVKSWLVGNRLVSAPFSTLFDPLISSNEDMKLIFPKVIELYEQLGADWIEIRTLFSTRLITDSKLKVSRHDKHHYLALDNDLESIMKSFHRTCVRKNIKRAISSRLQLREVDDIHDLKNCYRLLYMTRRDLGLPPVPFGFFKSIWDILRASKNVIFLIAELNDQPVAALMLLRFRDRISAEYLGWDRKFERMSPSVFIYWEAIKYAHAQGLRNFGFGRTFSLNRGLMDFKGRWTSDVMDFTELYYPKSFQNITEAKEFSWKYKLVRKISGSVPDFIFRRIGNFCYRHLG